MDLIGYLRVSTGRQVREGYGLADQERQIREWCKATGHHLVRFITDEGKSGELEPDERPGLLETLKAIKSGDADGLVMRDLDRFARTLTVQEAVLAQVWYLGGHAFVVTSTDEIPQDDPDDPMRTAMRQMAGVFAQLERAMLKKRMRNGRKTKATNGGYAYGAPAYGQSAVDKSLVANSEESKVIATIRTMRDEGKSYRQISTYLNDQGIRTKHGKTWHPQTVSNILSR